MSQPLLTLISEVLPIQRRDFSVATQALLDPYNANPILEGEWLELNSEYKAARGAGTPQATPAWQVWSERGRTDTRAIGKVPLLFIGGYEAETSICDPTGCAVGDALVISNVTVGGQTKRGLDKISASAGTYMIFAYVTKLVGTTKLRYWAPGTPAWKTVS